MSKGNIAISFRRQFLESLDEADMHHAISMCHGNQCGAMIAVIFNAGFEFGKSKYLGSIMAESRFTCRAYAFID